MLDAMASACARAPRGQAHQLRRGDHRAERADRARRVEPLLVVVGVNGFGDLALDLEAGQERFEHLGARRAPRLRPRPEPRRAAASSGASAGRRCGRRWWPAACRPSRARGRSCRSPGPPTTPPRAEGRGRTRWRRRASSLSATCASRIRPTSCVDPASITPRPSMMHRLAMATASAGNDARRAPAMKSTTSPVTLLQLCHEPSIVIRGAAFDCPRFARRPGCRLRGSAVSANY